MADLYTGYAPSNVGRDAKYSIRHDLDGLMKVHLVYRADHRERALLSTDLHRPLVDMVNDVKLEVQGAAGGVFYLNEWGHVLVKTADRQCYYAGTYADPMAFFYDGVEVGSVPPPGLRPGELWPGPHAGIAYRLSAGGTDVYYEHEVRPRRFEKHLLSDYAQPSDVQRLVRRIVKHKGPEGGRIYVN
jgi:hypothetical protein